AAVFTARQAADRIHAVEAIERVVEPGPAFGDGSGNLDTRGPLVDMKVALGAEAGDKVGDAESPAIVAHTGLDIHRSGRSTILVGGVARVVEIEGTHGFDVQAGLQAAADRIGNIESIQGEVGLVGGSPIDVQAAVHVLHDALEKRQRVAQGLRSRVG